MSEKTCQVKGCSEISFKTVDASLAKKVLSVEEDRTKVHLCKSHYKEYKKGTKKDREIQRMDWV